MSDTDTCLTKPNEFLPPRPGEKPAKQKDEDTCVFVYINNEPVQLTRIEALDLIAQITQSLMYLEK